MGDRELQEVADLICEFGTDAEQLPSPPDGMVKVQSAEFRDFIEQHSTYELVEEQFSYYGQIETAYMTDKSSIDSFEKPQATVEEVNGEPRVVTHYTTGIL